MKVTHEIEELLMVLDEMEEAIYQRVEAMLFGDLGKALYIERFIYPSIKKRRNEQIEKINQMFMKNERMTYGKTKTD